jgi:hypothetical protein
MLCCGEGSLFERQRKINVLCGDSIFASGYLTAEGQNEETLKLVTSAGFQYNIDSLRILSLGGD